MNTESTAWIFSFDEVCGRLQPTGLRHRSQITEGFVLRAFYYMYLTTKPMCRRLGCMARLGEEAVFY
jgi:hypothetical protein